MSLDRHADWHDTVRANWRKTTAFLLAAREPCIRIRDEEIGAVRGRVIVGFGPQDLSQWKPPASWVLAVILCPGDDLADVVAWVRRHRADADRVMFFLHPSVDLEGLRAWRDAGHAADRVDVVDSWRTLLKLLGLALNDRVYADWSAERR